MSVIRGKGPVIDAGTCRCCGAMKKCRLLNYEYDHLGKKEVYSDMIMDCFGLLLSHTDGEQSQRLVCATCVVRLREAATFRSQVLVCEEAFLLKMHRDGESDCRVKTEFKSEDGSNPDDDNSIPENDNLNSIDSTSDCENITEKTTEILNKDCDIKNNEKDIDDGKKSKVKSKSMVKKVEHLRMKKDLLNKMQRLRNLLNQKLKIPVPSQPKGRMRRPTPVRKMSQETMLRHNTVTIIENSYVCPFKNRISNYYCYYCKEIFTDCAELRSHTLAHDPRTFENFVDAKKIPRIDITRIDCRLCSEKIDDLDSFKNHIRTAHKKVIYPNVSNEFLLFRLSMDNLVCLECGCGYPFIDKLIEHMTEHFGKYVCDVCGTCFIEESSLGQHIRGHKKVDTNYPCEVCGKNLKTNYSRQLHIATVHEKRPVVGCYKCEASFLSYAQRNRHLINVHGDRRKFPCKSCDKVFDVRKTLMEHTRKYHLQVCRHQCDVCEQRFYVPSQLKEHKVTHTGERNYRCDYCDKSYPRRQSLQDHLRSHVNGRFECDVCHSTFTQNGSLKSHMKTHEEFEMAGSFNS